MKKGLTEMVFIIDRSGSMHGLVSDTIGGFNGTIDKQKKEEGEAIVTTVLFDNRYEVLHDRVDIGRVEEMTDKEYYTRGSTALLDAMGSAIQRMISVQKNLPEKDKAEKVVFVVITDGRENASCEYRYEDIRRMVKQQQEEYGWEFLFLGANIDAVAEGGRLGIRADRSVRYMHDKVGTRNVYDSVGSAVSELRTKRKISKEWSAKVEEDFAARSDEYWNNRNKR